MSGSLLHHLLLVSVVFWLIATAVESVVYRWIRRPLGRLDPRQRFRALLFIGLSPLLVGVGVAAATLLPSLGGVLWPGLDHCPDHHAGHDHLCLVHAPGPLGLEAWLLLGGLLAFIGPAAAHRMATLLRASSRARELVASGSDDGGVRVIENDVPFAATVGVIAPRVVLSRGLLDTLSEEHLKAVLAHERAHVRRCDPLLKVLASIVSVPWLPKARRALLADLELAAEQACDDEAAEELGDRLRVAQAILAMERLLTGLTSPHRAVTTAFDNAPAVERVELLLDERKPSSPIRFDILCVLFTAIALLSASSLHHTAESLLGLLGR
jgi:hypothetical protein